ncbi:MAG: ABC transporter ATP-binding protein [Candidatus Limnocylindria bacterium]
MSARGATVEFRHVSKVYGRAERGRPGAVDDLSLLVPAGAICVLVGPSGCGKTTSLKMVNRLIEPTSGQVLIDGRDVATVEPTALRRRIGYVIQQIGLFPHRTIAENVATVPELLGWPKPRVRERVDELLALVGLEPARHRDRYPAQLSGGERQRIGVARALAVEPPLMLMDEPFGAVDPIVRERLQDEFLRLHRALRMTVLFVTHDIDEAIKLGDRVAVMRAGRLVQYAPPDELLSAPADELVARFVGADRGLKRLSLMAVGDMTLREVPTAREGEPVADARRRLDGAAYVLLLDAGERPIGWVNLARAGDGALDADRADPSSPIFTRETRVREALSMLLASAVRTGVVVDERERYTGVLTLDDIGDLLAARAQ